MDPVEAQIDAHLHSQELDWQEQEGKAMVIINVWLTRGKKGTRDWESRSATQVMFKGLVWGGLSFFVVENHPKIRPLAARGWRVEGWALVSERP